MADQEDQNATLPEVELPDLDAADDAGLPDLGDASNADGLADLDVSMDSPGDLPDLDVDLPDLGSDEIGALDADLPDLGSDDMQLEDPGDMGMEQVQQSTHEPFDLSDLKNPVSNSDASPSLSEITARETPPIAASSNTASADSVMAFKKIQGIKVRVQVMLGETRLSVSQLANLKKGEFIQLDTKVGEPVNILANGSLIARGEIAVEDEETPRFGITLTEIIDSSVLSN